MGFSGPDPLSPADILAWSTLTGATVTPREFRALMSMDAAYMEGMRAHQEEQRARYRDDRKERTK